MNQSACQSALCQLTVVICALCLNELLYEREEETMSALKRKLTTLNIDQKIEILTALQSKAKTRHIHYYLRDFSKEIEVGTMHLGQTG